MSLRCTQYSILILLYWYILVYVAVKSQESATPTINKIRNFTIPYFTSFITKKLYSFDAPSLVSPLQRVDSGLRFSGSLKIRQCHTGEV